MDLPSKEGVTPLMAAAGVEFGDRVTRGRNRTDEGVLATMQLLLDAGADINARMVTERRNRSCRGHVAGGGVRASSCAARPEPGAEPRTRCRTRRRCTAPRERGFTAFVKFLVEHGADLTAKDADGRTALDLAKGVGVPGVRQAAGEPFPETVAYLESLIAAAPAAPATAR